MAVDSYEIELAEETAVAHVQAMILRLLDKKGMSRAKLAEAMGVSQAHISQLLGDAPRNLSVRKAARVFHALGEELIMTCAGIEELNRGAHERAAQIEASLKVDPFDWFEGANSNDADYSGDICKAELIAA